MSLKADWRLADIDADADDPFARVILSTGLRVDLGGDAKAIDRGLIETLGLEGALAGDGVTCPLKDGGQDCLTCKEYVGDHLEERLSSLCRLGRDQKMLEARARALFMLRRAPFEEMAAGFGQYTHLLPDLDELLV